MIAPFMPQSVIPVRAILGEGPIWDAATQRLWWIDIDGCMVHRHDPISGRNESWRMTSEPGTIVPRRNGGAVVALNEGLVALDEQGNVTPLGVGHEHGDGFRFNDGKCDANGRLWVGTLSYPGVSRAHLYCWDGRTRRRVLEHVGCSNGIGWSPDGRTLYYIDTITRRLDAFAFDIVTGNISNRRTALEFPEPIGSPDGLAVDVEGMVWVGMWGTSRVQRCDPIRGVFLEYIPLPVTQVTACVFGGPDLRDLYITTAARDTDPTQQPLAGHVFHCRPGVAGLPTHASL